MIHDILLSLPFLFFASPCEFLLILCENEIRTPIVLSSGMLGQTSIRGPVNWLGNTVDVATVIPLEILLEVNLEVSVLIGGATCAHECGLSTGRTELLVHLFCDLEAAVAA